MNVFVAPNTRAAKRYHERAALHAPVEAAIVPGIPPTRDRDLRYRGGKIIVDLTFSNFYLGGSEAWSATDVENIDRSLAAAMSDEGLENVMVQYFPKRPTTTFKPSHVLPGPLSGSFSRGDVEKLVSDLQGMGAMAGFKAASSVFNFMLPSGIVLTDDAMPRRLHFQKRRKLVAPGKGGVDSLHGLGGYHGSVHLGKVTLYYAIGVYSEVRNGRENGIPVFGESWKNVVATFYHELNEARTDPDVEDVIDGKSQRLLGWVSNQGDEVGDFPVAEANSLTDVFQEVPLASGAGKVPVQFEYSNAVHGPEGPRDTPYPFWKKRR